MVDQIVSTEELVIERYDPKEIDLLYVCIPNVEEFWILTFLDEEKNTWVLKEVKSKETG